MIGPDKEREDAKAGDGHARLHAGDDAHDYAERQDRRVHAPDTTPLGKRLLIDAVHGERVPPVTDEHNYSWGPMVIACADARENLLARIVVRVRELHALLASLSDVSDWQCGSLRRRADDIAGLVVELGSDFPDRPEWLDTLRLATDLLVEVADITGLPLPDPVAAGIRRP